MAKYIKSHSNYVIRTKHQATNDGTIFERDITTIGGRDQFARGQVPIYKTGNFVITINNDRSDYNKKSEMDWQRNDEGEIWTLNNLRNFEKDEKTSDDRKIVIKKDYYDIRDFAYYGSCAELMRGSVNNILKNYPGELFIPYETLYIGEDGSVQYTKEAADLAFGEGNYKIERRGIKGYYTSFEKRKSRIIEYDCDGVIEEHELKTVSLLLDEDELTEEELEELEMGIPYTREFKYLTDEFGNLLKDDNGNIIGIKSLSLIDNPFGINIHDKFVPEGANPLRYFAEGGINNYVGYLKLNDDDKIDIDGEWKIDAEHEYTITIESIVLDGIGEKVFREETFNADGSLCPNDECLSNLNVNLLAFEEVEKKFGCILECLDPGKYIGRIELCFRKNHYTFKTTPGLQRDENGEPIIDCCDGSLEFDSGDGLDADTEIEGKYKGEDTQVDSFIVDDCEYRLTIYMFMGNNNEIKYLVEDVDQAGNIDFNFGDEDSPCVTDKASAITDFGGSFYWKNFVSRIRPTEEIIDDYFDNLDLFEKTLLNRYSDPLYTATFELLSDNDFGNYTYIRQFTFPTTYGGWNLGSATKAFTTYINSLSEVGEYYDSKYTDNLWRSMTHESIKNFDWTYTRHYTPGEEEPYTEAGTKIQKIIRLYGREFDEVKSFIESIDDFNTITYDDVNNLPDYFFSDKLEEQGWDVKFIHTLHLSEYINGHMSVPVDIHKLFKEKYDEDGNRICTEDAEKMNYFYDHPLKGPDTHDINETFNVNVDDLCATSDCYTDFDIGLQALQTDEDITEYFERHKITIQRVFNTEKITVVPYSCSNITTIKETKYSKKYFDNNKSIVDFEFDKEELDPCLLDGDFDMQSIVKTGEDVRNGYHNDCGEIIRIYCDEEKYTSDDVNNEFMKRLYLNSPEIWRHKGTIEGMEMLLSMFGLRSKNRVLTDEKYFVNQKDLENVDTNIIFDVDKTELKSCSLSNIINLTAEKGSCLATTDLGKTYYKNYEDKLYRLYDYDIREYTLFTTREDDEWLPEKNMYKYDWINSTKLVTYDTPSYKNGEYITYQGLPVSYRNETDFNGNELRHLYPHFNTNGIYDGNPYYQMDGGWLQKKPFVFDVYNNIIPEDYESDNRKNKALFTETVKNIKTVKTLGELLSNPSIATHSGDICQVTDLTGRYAVIDGYLYPLYTEFNENEAERGYSFFYVPVSNHSMSVGNELFTDYVVVSNPYSAGYKERIDLLDEYYENREVKIYILQKEVEDENTKEKKKVYDIDVYSKDNSISTFTIFENGKYMEGDNYTNYFRLNNVDFYNELSVLGWQQLKDDEYEYYRINTITDYRKGNNPHTGHMMYDNGHKYLTYFQKIFKTVIDEDLIDYRLYDEYDDKYTYEIEDLGFTNLIDRDVCEPDYDKFLREDSKCHFFGKLISKIDETCNDSRKNMSCFEKREKANASQFDNISNECVVRDDSYKLTDIFRKSKIDDSTGKLLIKNLKYGSVYDSFGEYAEHYNSKTDTWENGYDESKIDNVTDQIVNTKRIEIEFFIKNRHEYSKEWLEEIKYIDSVILPYLEQMIPSTVIWRVKYTTRDKEDWCEPDVKPCPTDNKK